MNSIVESEGPHTCSTRRVSLASSPLHSRLAPSSVMRLLLRSRCTSVLLNFSASPRAKAPSFPKPFQERSKCFKVVLTWWEGNLSWFAQCDTQKHVILRKIMEKKTKSPNNFILYFFFESLTLKNLKYESRTYALNWHAAVL